MVEQPFLNSTMATCHIFKEDTGEPSRQVGVSNLPRVVTQPRLDRESNSRPCGLKPDALPLRHHATLITCTAISVFQFFRIFCYWLSAVD